MPFEVGVDQILDVAVDLVAGVEQNRHFIQVLLQLVALLHKQIALPDQAFVFELKFAVGLLQAGDLLVQLGDGFARFAQCGQQFGVALGQFAIFAKGGFQLLGGVVALACGLLGGELGRFQRLVGGSQFFLGLFELGLHVGAGVLLGQSQLLLEGVALLAGLIAVGDCVGQAFVELGVGLHHVGPVFNHVVALLGALVDVRLGQFQRFDDVGALRVGFAKLFGRQLELFAQLLFFLVVHAPRPLQILQRFGQLRLNHRFLLPGLRQLVLQRLRPPRAVDQILFQPLFCAAQEVHLRLHGAKFVPDVLNGRGPRSNFAWAGRDCLAEPFLRSQV